MAPQVCQSTNLQESIQTGPILHIIHRATTGSAAWCRQTVELHQGLRGPPVTTFVRRVPSNTVVPSARASPRALPVRSNAAFLLRQAIKWREELDSGQIPNQAAIARREHITRARVTQILALLRLPPETQEQVLAASPTKNGRVLTERGLRPALQGLTD